MKSTIPAGRIAISIWFAAALALALAMSLCGSCGATPSAVAKASCTAAR